jgi:hypothetical protein
MKLSPEEKAEFKSKAKAYWKQLKHTKLKFVFSKEDVTVFQKYMEYRFAFAKKHMTASNLSKGEMKAFNDMDAVYKEYFDQKIFDQISGVPGRIVKIIDVKGKVSEKQKALDDQEQALIEELSKYKDLSKDEIDKVVQMRSEHAVLVFECLHLIGNKADKKYWLKFTEMNNKKLRAFIDKAYPMVYGTACSAKEPDEVVVRPEDLTFMDNVKASIAWATSGLALLIS